MTRLGSYLNWLVKPNLIDHDEDDDVKLKAAKQTNREVGTDRGRD
jgi:hypothetical protein